MTQRNPFVLHTSEIGREGCPTDPRSPVPPPWENGPSGAAPGRSPGVSAGGRISEIGAMLAKWARNPELKPYEELFRSEPNEAWFDFARDPDHPTQFEIATVRPETGQSIILFDYEVRPYAFSGVTALDYEPLPDNMISGVFGYWLKINGQDPGQLKYRLQPLDSTIRQQSLRFNQRLQKGVNQMTADDFAISQADSYASAAGYGTGLHPQTSVPYGARRAPFTEYIHDNEVLTIGGVVYEPIDVPLAFVEARVAGFKCSSALAKTIITSLRASIG